MAGLSVWRNGITVLVVVATTLAVAPTLSYAGSSPKATSATQFGTLVTGGSTAHAEATAGVHDAMLELDWASYEPEPGVFDQSYASQMRSWLAQLKAAGMSVTLGLGMHYTPAWLDALPDSHFVDQYGDASTDANLVFNEALRVQASSYMAQVAHDLGMKNFAAVRITSGGNAEMMFPAGGTYWAFDVGAQNGADMPPTMVRNPFPGWHPGTPGLTAAQADSWLSWYVGALDDDASWQLRTLGSLGFSGVYQVVTPGSGIRPDGAAYLDQHELPNGVAGVGALWDRFYAGLAGKKGVEVYVSSVGDGSGNDDSCGPADDSVALSSPAADSWSATRWLSRIADRYTMAKAGENPGYAPGTSSAVHYSDASGAGLMATSIRQATSCGFGDFYWAHDFTLWDGVTTLSRYTSDIASAVRASATARTTSRS